MNMYEDSYSTKASMDGKKNKVVVSLNVLFFH